MIDDHELLSSALAATFAEHPDLAPVGSVGTIADGTRVAAALRPDVILADRRLPDGDIDQHLGALLRASPSSHILVMTGWLTRRSSVAALDAGARGVVSKAQPVTQILDAITRVAAGEVVIPANLVPVLLERSGRSAHARGRELSARELDVVEGLALGESTAEVAQRLCISHNTVRNHLAGAMLKLDAHSRLSVVMKAMSLGLVAPRVPGCGVGAEGTGAW